MGIVSSFCDVFLAMFYSADEVNFSSRNRPNRTKLLFIIISCSYWFSPARSIETKIEPIETMSERCGDSSVHQNSLCKMVFNSHALSITSVNFNNGSTSPDWIDHIFGGSSVHHVVDSKNSSSTLRSRYGDEIISQSTVKKWRNSQCSIEILGYGAVARNLDFRNYPLNIEHRNKGAGAGVAILQINPDRKDTDFAFLSFSSFKCVYRVMYENRRRENVISTQYYWPLLFYCPIEKDEACNYLLAKSSTNSFVGMDLRMHLRKKALWNSFRINMKLFNPAYKPNESLRPVSAIDRSAITIIHQNSQPLAVCLVIPHESSIDNLIPGGSSMLREWIRYYLNLNMRLLIYDTRGQNKLSIFDDIDGKSLGRNPYTNSPFLVYHNYTIRQRIEELSVANSAPNLYDNNMEDLTESKTASTFRSLDLRRTDDDKVLTLTHCRFEAKAVFKITNVFVIDFDEFLFCPAGDYSAAGLIIALHKAIEEAKLQQVEQMIFPRQTMRNKSPMPSCIRDHADRHLSPLSCYYPSSLLANYDGLYANTKDDQFKSLHLGHNCPLTGFHEACVSDPSINTHNCLCNSANSQANQCRILHATMNSINATRLDSTAAQGSNKELPRNELLKILESIRH